LGRDIRVGLVSELDGISNTLLQAHQPGMFRVGVLGNTKVDHSCLCIAVGGASGLQCSLVLVRSTIGILEQSQGAV